MKLGEYLGKRVLGDVGIELEYAGNFHSFDKLDGRLWAAKDDPSIGGGVEFVLRKPIAIADVPDSLANIQAVLKSPENKYRLGPSAGVHVHVNVLDLSPVELASFICAYYAIEPALMALCGPSRKGNLFCLSAGEAEAQVDAAIRGVVFKDPKKYWDDDNIRSSAMNLTAVPRYGSLEFRGMKSTDNMELITLWANLLVELRDNARQFNPPQIVEISSVEGFTVWSKRLLPNHYPALKGMQKQIRQSIRDVAQDFAYCVNWDEHYGAAPAPAKNPFAQAKKEVRDEALFV